MLQIKGNSLNCKIDERMGFNVHRVWTRRIRALWF